MRTATIAMAVQSLSREMNASILLVTADTMCGDSAYHALSFLPAGAVATLKHAGTVVVKAEDVDEANFLRTATTHFEIAFDEQPRLAAEAVFFQSGQLIYRNTCDGVMPTRLAA